ncbi:MAG: OsmC family protein [Gemmatimonadaceae bacterium]
MSELPEEADRWTTAHVGASGYRTELSARTHNFVADEPGPLGGTDTGPTPYEYLLGALASCMAMTLRMYADRKKWPLESVEVRLRTTRMHKVDCENCETSAVGIKQLDRTIELKGALSDEQRKRLLEIAERCPVKQTFASGIAFNTVDQPSG